MPNAGFYRTKARLYLRQAAVCGDEILAGELRSLARSYTAEAERLERDAEAVGAPSGEVHFASRR